MTASAPHDTPPAPLRVLHVLRQLNRGGVETWAVQLLRAARPDRLRMDFLVHTAEPGALDAEVGALGGVVIRCPLGRDPLAFARRLHGLLRAHGPYAAVHSHVHHFSGVVLAVAHAARVPVRIAHSHTDSFAADARASLPRRLYLAAAAALIRGVATRGFAVSEVAAVSLFGRDWPSDSRWSILHCGLDYSAIRAAPAPSVVRAELGVRPGHRVVGHVGRFVDVKNHRFLVKVAEEVLRRDDRVTFVLVGDGALRGQIEAQVRASGLEGHFRFTGVRGDVPRLLASFDAFLLPSLREGLPLVGLEAQAAGVPLVASDAITPELAVIPRLVRWRSLRDPASAWAEAVLEAACAGRMERARAAELLERSTFGIARTLAELEAAYGGGAGSRTQEESDRA